MAEEDQAHRVEKKAGDERPRARPVSLDPVPRRGSLSFPRHEPIPFLLCCLSPLATGLLTLARGLGTFLNIPGKASEASYGFSY